MGALTQLVAAQAEISVDPRGLPVAQQRLVIRLGALLRGSCWILRWISSRSIGSAALANASIRADRLAAKRSTIFLRFTSRAIIDFFAMRQPGLESGIRQHKRWVQLPIS